MLAPTIFEAVGHTPLVGLNRLSPKPEVKLWAKIEGGNPAGSVKDRVARSMILDAEQKGLLKPGMTILEPTSGNTGLALALLGRQRGYNVTVVIPDNLGVERTEALAAFGADIIFSDGRLGSNGAIAKAQEVVSREPHYFMPFQYGNPANPLAHYQTTGPEILADLPEVDVLIAGMGTGGTLMGAGRRLKEHNPNIKVIAVEPHPGELVQGLRSLDEGYIPPIIDLSLLDGKIVVRTIDAFAGAKALLQEEGIFAGISSGAVLHGAIKYASRLDRGNVVMVLADAGWKYLSSRVWTRSEDSLKTITNDQLWW